MSKLFVKNLEKNKRSIKLLLFPEYQQLAGNIIQYYDQNTGHKFHDISVPEQAVNRHKNDTCFQSTGSNPAAHKFCQLRNDCFGRSVMAAEHKGFVGQVSKGNRNGPGNHITDRCTETQ